MLGWPFCSPATTGVLLKKSYLPVAPPSQNTRLMAGFAPKMPVLSLFMYPENWFLYRNCHLGGTGVLLKKLISLLKISSYIEPYCGFNQNSMEIYLKIHGVLLKNTWSFKQQKAFNPLFFIGNLLCKYLLSIRLSYETAQ